MTSTDRLPKHLAGLCGLLLAQAVAFAQTAPAIQWQRCIGGTNSDDIQAIALTPDDGYIVAGESNSYDGDAQGRPPVPFADYNYDAFAVKLTGNGTIQKRKLVGLSRSDLGNDIKPTVDGGYIMAGQLQDPGEEWSDALVVKFRPSGSIQWQVSLGGSFEDYANAVEQTSDGGFIMAGASASEDGDVSGNHGDYDAWVVKLNAAGAISWQRCLGGSSLDKAAAIQQTSDGGYILAGTTVSHDGDVSGFHNSGYFDAWVVKLDGLGTIQWQRCLGGTNAEDAYAVEQTSDGGFILAGHTRSSNGDVQGHHGPNGSDDAWVVKLDGNGAIQWTKALGGSKWDEASDIQQTTDGGYIMAGLTRSKDGDVSGLHGSGYNWDAWVVKLDALGILQWQRCLGGSGQDKANAIQQTPDGGYIMAGYTMSNDGDVLDNHGFGSSDGWVVKLEGSGTMLGEQSAGSSANATASAGHVPGDGVHLAGQDLIIYPTITDGTVNLAWAKEGSVELSLMDATGRLLEKRSVTGSSLVLSLQGQRTGIYLVQVRFADGTQQIGRVVKE